MWIVLCRTHSIGMFIEADFDEIPDFPPAPWDIYDTGRNLVRIDGDLPAIEPPSAG